MAAATEYTSVAQEIYISYFGRPADRAGLANMTAALAAANAPTTTAGLDAAYNTNSTVRALIDNFGSSAESNSLYPANATDAFVTAIFQNLFNRDPDQGGLAFWSAAIDSGNLTRAAAAHSILAGAVTLAGADAQVIANKVAVASNFTTAIDTAAESNAYSGNAAAAIAREMLHSVNGTTVPANFQPTVNTTLANLVTNVSAGTTSSLTLNADIVNGTSGNDVFIARILDNSNTLQSGDVINGGAGSNDVLRADIGNSQKFALTAETTGVETVEIRAQAVATDSTDNNTSKTNEVQIDAERMHGVTRWESNNSRADLLIEDVRILDAQITKDVTIAFVSSDPGNVDYGVYFDQHSLRAAPVATSGATLRLQLMDTRSNDAGGAPLFVSPYNGFQFFFNGALVKVQSTQIDAAQTYPELLAAIKAAVANTPAISGFVVTLGGTFNAADTLSGRVQTGFEIVLTNPGSGVISTDTPTGSTDSAGWTANGPVPPSSGLHTAMLTAPAAVEAFKVTSTIILDDVGRGSMGGDLVVGGLSVGDTSTSHGVERFEITVERSSKLQTINSTNNALQEVTIVNGVVNKGDLTVTGTLPGGQNSSGGSNIDAPLPGVVTVNGGNQHTEYGFSDVRLIDASTLTGNLTFDSVITDRVIAKYMTLVDSQTGPATDNINFVYTGGNGNDTMIVDIDASVLASRSHIVSGLTDFTLAVNGGAGNDNLTVRLIKPASDAATGGNQNWYNNQDLNNNVTIDGGAGNDTIRKLGAGDTVINGGAGSDTIYSDNTGFQVIAVPSTVQNPTATTANVNGTWVFNTTDQVTAAAGVRDINDLRSGLNDSYALSAAKLTVTFKGIPTAVAVTIPGATGFTTDLEINQAIKAAINTDAVLSKLLIATDGPANSLVVSSLIDGVVSTTDLSISIAAPAVGTLTASQIATLGVAYNIATPTEASILNVFTNSLLNYTTKGDYVTALATAAGVDITGANSTSTSDNIITPGADNDVVVLGTTVGTTFATSSNEVVKFGAAFGNDTIVHFATTGEGVDHLDFVGLGGSVTLAGGFNEAVLGTSNKSITVAATTTANDTAAEIAALYTVDSTVARTHVYVAVGANNIGTVYQIADAAGVAAGNVVATVAGTIDLADTNWLLLDAANFVDSSAANYFLVEGGNGSTTPVGPVNPGQGNTAVNVVGATSQDAAASNVSYNVAVTSSYDVSIANFAALDAIHFTAGTGISITNTDGTDGLIDIVGSLNGLSVTIHLTGVAAASDGQVFSEASFNNVFGAGSLTAV